MVGLPVNHVRARLPDEGRDHRWFGVGNSDIGDRAGDQFREKESLSEGVLVVLLLFHDDPSLEWLDSDRC